MFIIIRIVMVMFIDEKDRIFSGNIFWIVSRAMVDFFFSVFIIFIIQLWKGAMPILIKEMIVTDEFIVIILFWVLFFRNIMEIKISKIRDGRAWMIK